jgi:Fic family protein
MRFFLSYLLEVRTFINISFGSHIVSQMNAEMIIDEVDALVIHIKDRALEDVTRAGYVLSKSFFMPETSSRTDDKGQTEGKGSSASSEKTKTSVSFKKDDAKLDVSASKNSRKASILELLKKQGNLTIKDIARFIPGCSIKTIQRELLDLVRIGQVKKEGERRWSRYSLK